MQNVNENKEKINAIQMKIIKKIIKMKINKVSRLIYKKT